MCTACQARGPRRLSPHCDVVPLSPRVEAVTATNTTPVFSCRSPGVFGIRVFGIQRRWQPFLVSSRLSPLPTVSTAAV